MNSKQISILVFAFIAGCLLCRFVSAQEITGPSVVTMGRQAVFSLEGVDSADWGITATGCDMNVDSNTLRVYVTPYAKSVVTLNAAVSIEGKPKLVSYQFDVVSTDYDKDDGDKDEDKTPEPDPPPMTLSEWVAANKPGSLNASQLATLAKAFSSTATNIDRGAIRTEQGAFNSIRTTITPYFGNKEDVKAFLAEISKRTEGQGIKELSESYKTVADALGGQASDLRPQDSVSFVYPKPEARSQKTCTQCIGGAI